MNTYLYCPKCGVKTFFIIPDQGPKIFFHVDRDHVPFPADFAPADLSGQDFSKIHCRSCSWSGSIQGLVKVFTR